MNRFKKNIIFPKNLKLKKGLNIALVGSGNMAFEYAKVIKSFYHNIDAIVGGNNKNKSDLIKKYNIKNDFKSLEAAIINSKNIDAWIICTSWHKLNSYFKLSLKHKLNFIMEKSMIASSAELIKVSSQLSKKDKQNFFISYNRVFYDYVPLLTSILQKNSIDQIYLNDKFQWYDLADLFKDISKIFKNNKLGLNELYSVPISNYEIINLFKKIKINKKRLKPINYSIKPKEGFCKNKRYILSRIKNFIRFDEK